MLFTVEFRSNEDFSSSSFEGYPLRARHKQDWGRGFILLLPQTAALPESDAGSDVIKPALSFVIQNHQTSCSMWCSMYRHTIGTWSTVCSEAPHSQFGEGARPHLCMDEWNRPTPVRRQLSLTQAARGKPIPTGLAPVPGTKARSLEAFLQYSIFYLLFIHSEARMPSLARLSKRFQAAGTNGRLDLSLTWRVSEDPIKRPYKI